MPKKLSREFYTRPTLIVAKDLLGKYLVRRVGRKTLVGKIVETEAYIGPKDKASHSYGGKITDRTKTFYLKGGHLYVYLCYGIYLMLNIVTEKENKPEAVLIRALEPVGKYDFSKIKNLSNGPARSCYSVAGGPGKLCRWLEIDRSFNGEDLTKSKRIWLDSRGEKMKKSRIKASRRIGVDYAQEWANKPWRFYISENPFVSRR